MTVEHAPATWLHSLDGSDLPPEPPFNPRPRRQPEDDAVLFVIGIAAGVLMALAYAASAARKAADG